MQEAQQCEDLASEELLQAVEEFNAEEWFECHETLEELWVGKKGELRDLYQGMLQLAAALHHWRGGNYKGCVVLLERGGDLLGRVAPVCRGLDVAALRADGARFLAELTVLGEERMEQVPDELIPKAQLVRPVPGEPQRELLDSAERERLYLTQLLRRRRSIRTFTKEPVCPEDIELLSEALLRAPTSRNFRPWTFMVVSDPELLARLSEAKEHGSAFLKRAPLGIVICADPAKSDVWVEDCSIAAILGQMEALSLGLGSCWIQIRERRHDETMSAEEYVRQVMGIPDDIKVASIIAIGHPAVERSPLPASDLDYRKIRRNGW